ncbi:DUF4752 family protein [Caenorhabditis elegans]|uniref:DUF4752 family protein n=1 Tax=Caenorhabditis elegans TaxID=6239 RepID=Q7YTH2_CAEEL|nr:DUF4752 family protein [Caenorhabditis elegans]CAE18051.2 DUF4752 family protein [Caenorhabditis elegans]|eukprot:NP_001023003.2 Uncharacterized protein CELE_ZK512.10 [Caenorhabditis elegans]
MYQLDSWYSVLFELLLVGFSLYNSLRMTTWWDTVAKGASIAVNGAAKHSPSVADHYGIRTDKNSVRSYRKSSVRSPITFEMGDGIEVAH